MMGVSGRTRIDARIVEAERIAHNYFWLSDATQVRDRVDVMLESRAKCTTKGMPSVAELVAMICKACIEEEIACMTDPANAETAREVMDEWIDRPGKHELESITVGSRKLLTAAITEALDAKDRERDAAQKHAKAQNDLSVRETKRAHAAADEVARLHALLEKWKVTRAVVHSSYGSRWRVDLDAYDAATAKLLALVPDTEEKSDVG